MKNRIAFSIFQNVNVALFLCIDLAFVLMTYLNHRVSISYFYIQYSHCHELIQIQVRLKSFFFRESKSRITIENGAIK